MSRIALIALLSIAASSLAGCSSRVSRPEVNLAELGVHELGGLQRTQAGVPREYTDGEIAAVMDRRARAPFPGRLGVARIGRDGGYPNALVSLGDEERRAWERELGSPGVFTDVNALTTLLAPGGPLRLSQLRFEAARLRSDFLLVYRLEHDENFYNTPLSLLYLTVAGAWLVPATVFENHTAGVAALVDVRSGFIYFAAEAEAKVDAVRPWFTERAYESLRERAERDVLEKLHLEVSKQLNAVYREALASRPAAHSSRAPAAPRQHAAAPPTASGRVPVPAGRRYWTRATR